MARKLSIVLAVVLAIFAASPNLGYAQGRGLGVPWWRRIPWRRVRVPRRRVPWWRLGLARRGLGLGRRLGLGPGMGLDLALEPLCSPRYQHKVPKQRGVNTNG
jgi:hypothetical protein